MDVWNAAKKVAGYERLVRKVFKQSVETALFDEFLELAAAVTKPLKPSRKWIRRRVDDDTT